MDLGLDSPVKLRVGKSWVVVEHAAVPSAHLMVRDLVGILDPFFLQHFDGLLVEIIVDPRGDVPVLLGDELVPGLGLGRGARLALEFLGEGDVVEEGPRVVELVVPRGLEVDHG